MTIRPATEADFDAMWPIFQAVAAAGDSYTFTEGTPREAAYEYFLGPGVASFVAERDGRIVGFYKIVPNMQGRGAHVANASFMVDPAAQGQGIGRELGIHCLEEARIRGFRAMQFNFVVSTNEAAVTLWQQLGFAIVGTLPQVYDHRALGLVDAYVMYRKL